MDITFPDSSTQSNLYYHNENACGKYNDAVDVTPQYINRFYCDTKDPPQIKASKFLKAKACFIGRVFGKAKYGVQTSASKNFSTVVSNENHDYPLLLSYAFAKDCANKLEIDHVGFETNAISFLQKTN